METMAIIKHFDVLNHITSRLIPGAINDVSGPFGFQAVRRFNKSGEILADEIAELGINATELARIIHVPANRISQIIAGKRAITADTALRLGRWFGTGPNIWLNLQQAYELDLVCQEIGPELENILPREMASS